MHPVASPRWYERPDRWRPAPLVWPTVAAPDQHRRRVPGRAQPGHVGNRWSTRRIGRHDLPCLLRLGRVEASRRHRALQCFQCLAQRFAHSSARAVGACPVGRQQQRIAKNIAQLRQMHTHRRLRQIQPVRRAGHVVFREQDIKVSNRLMSSRRRLFMTIPGILVIHFQYTGATSDPAASQTPETQR